MKPLFFAIVNPAAGGGRCGKLAGSVLDRVREAGIELEVVQTKRPREATDLARNAYAKGFRNFLAVGGDGTSYEVINGLFPEASSGGKPALGFLPLGTGNSFLRDFTSRGVEHTLEALKNGARRPCDLIRLRHSAGDVYFLNLLSLGFPADVAELTNRRFKRWGQLGYILGVLAQLFRLEPYTFPHTLDDTHDWDRRPCLFLAFCNSKFTGGRMMIAPRADPADAYIEYVRWGQLGRLRLLWMFPSLFTGTHIEHPLASRSAAKRIDLDLNGSVNVMIDGEILCLECRSVEIVPQSLDVVV